ncbi:uncharacterized protein SCHCODRAFT_02498874 [Schizophyllum commune H4-8]|nr:uncharacterized protein SCHCODRAFT_02498874 [Schizophyllum commune H4-8]KAI5892981.1 hypothetical protein SCHCODRAFT_02498874 [Schizophyllum commune H4-8]
MRHRPRRATPRASAAPPDGPRSLNPWGSCPLLNCQPDRGSPSRRVTAAMTTSSPLTSPPTTTVMGLPTNTKPPSHASSSNPAATSNTKSSGSFPAVLIPRDMLRADLEARTPKDLTSLIFSLMDRFPDTVPFVAKQTNTALVFAPSGKGLSNAIVVPAAKWFEKDREEGRGDVDEEKNRERWDRDPTPVAREVAGRSEKENMKEAKGRKDVNGKELAAQSEADEPSAQPTTLRKRAASRTRSPSPNPPFKRRKRAAAPTDNNSATTSTSFDPAGVYTINCPYLLDQWPDDCSGPLTLRLALSSTGRHLWGAFKFGIVEGVLRSTSPAPFLPDTTITFDWRGREMGEDTVTWDEGNVGTLTLATDGTPRGTLDGAFLDPDQCVFSGRKKVGDKRFRAPGERLVKRWKREWRRLPALEVDQGNVIYVDEALEEAMRRKEPPLPSDTTEDETICKISRYSGSSLPRYSYLVESKTKGMHLHVPEILLEIARDEGLGKGDLYNLSLSCKLWRDIAEVVLWKDMQGFMPVLATIPGLYTRENLAVSMELDRAIRPEDWLGERVQQRRSLVTRLVMPCEYWWDVQSAIAACPPPEGLLFPNLRQLTVVPMTPYDNRGLHPGLFDLLVSPTVSSLHLVDLCGIHISDPRACIFRFPQLTDLRVKENLQATVDGEDDEGFAFAVVDAAGRLQDLSTVDLSLKAAFESSHLKDLSAVRALRSLALIPYEDVLMMLHSGRARPLEMVELTVTLHTSRALLDLTSALRNHSAPSTMREITIKPDYWDPPSWKLTLALLGPLSTFPHLTRVEFTNYPLDLSDADVMRMAEWWPDLRVLRIDQYRSIPNPATLTLNSLIHLAHGCAKLERIDLPLHARNVPDVAGTIGGSASFVVALDVGNAPIGDPAEVAGFLRNIFPGVKEVEFVYGSSWKKRWETVNEYLKQ